MATGLRTFRFNGRDITIHPYDVLQRFSVGQWEDYASIKNGSDAYFAVAALTESGPDRFRIVRAGQDITIL